MGRELKAKTTSFPLSWPVDRSGSVNEDKGFYSQSYDCMQSTQGQREQISVDQQKQLGTKESKGNGKSRFDEGGSRIPNQVEGDQADPALGPGTVNKPRKRLALACINCRTRKIKCDPSDITCRPCAKAKLSCTKATLQPTSGETLYRDNAVPQADVSVPDRPPRTWKHLATAQARTDSREATPIPNSSLHTNGLYKFISEPDDYLVQPPPPSSPSSSAVKSWDSAIGMSYRPPRAMTPFVFPPPVSGDWETLEYRYEMHTQVLGETQGQKDVWAYARSLESRFTKAGRDYELRITRLQQEVISLKTRIPTQYGKPSQRPTATSESASSAVSVGGKDTGDELKVLHFPQEVPRLELPVSDVPFVCPVCATSFKRQHNLKSHLLTHSQGKPYVCQTCQGRFRRLHDLKRHTKLHSGERPHVCHKCDRRFARGDGLARHCSGRDGCAGRQSIPDNDDDADVSNAKPARELKKVGSAEQEIRSTPTSSSAWSSSELDDQAENVPQFELPRCQVQSSDQATDPERTSQANTVDLSKMETQEVDLMVLDLRRRVRLLLFLTQLRDAESMVQLIDQSSDSNLSVEPSQTSRKRAASSAPDQSHQPSGSDEEDYGDRSHPKRRKAVGNPGTGSTFNKFPCIFKIGDPANHGNCRTKYPHISKLQRHLKRHKCFVCELCMVRFDDRQGLAAHKDIPVLKCMKSCQKTECRRTIPSETVMAGTCDCITTAERQWLGLYRKQFPDLPLPADFQDVQGGFPSDPQIIPFSLEDSSFMVDMFPPPKSFDGTEVPRVDSAFPEPSQPSNRWQQPTLGLSGSSVDTLQCGDKSAAALERDNSRLRGEIEDLQSRLAKNETQTRKDVEDLRQQVTFIEQRVSQGAAEGVLGVVWEAFAATGNKQARKNGALWNLIASVAPNVLGSVSTSTEKDGTGVQPGNEIGFVASTTLTERDEANVPRLEL